MSNACAILTTDTDIVLRGAQWPAWVAAGLPVHLLPAKDLLIKSFEMRGIDADFDTRYNQIGDAFSAHGINAICLTGPGCSGKTKTLETIGIRASLVTSVTFLGCTNTSPYSPGIDYMPLRRFTGACSTAGGVVKCAKEANSATFIESHLYIIDNCEIAGGDLHAFDEQLRRITSNQTAFGGCWVLMAADLRHPITVIAEDSAVKSVSAMPGVATIATGPSERFPMYWPMYLACVCDEALASYIKKLPSCPPELRDVIVRIYVGGESKRRGEALLGLSEGDELSFPVRRRHTGGRDVVKAIEKRSEVASPALFKVTLHRGGGCVTTEPVLATRLASPGEVVRLPAWFPCRFVTTQTMITDGINTVLPVVEPCGKKELYVIPYVATVKSLASGTLTEEGIPLRASTALTATEATGVHYPDNVAVLVEEKILHGKMNALLQFILHRGGKHYSEWVGRK